MFKNKAKETDEYKIYYEICDKDYSFTLKELRAKGLNELSIVKYPMIPSYKEGIINIKNETVCTPTRIKKLDNALGDGLRAGLYVFGANPGLGKTSLILHILLNLAFDKQHSLLFNLEMSPFQIITKLLSNTSYRKNKENENYSKMTINQLSSASLYNAKTKELNKTLEVIIKDYKTLIDPYINIINYSEGNNCRYVEFIDTALKNYKDYHKIKPVVVVDFLQLLQLKPVYDDNINSDRVIDKRLEMNDVIEKLKKYSNHYKVPIILISSLSRGAYTKEVTDDLDIEYSLSIFKETGHIEYTADFLALLTKGENIVRFGEEEQSTIIVNVLKSRYGKCDYKIKLGFIPEYSYFEEICE